MLRTIKIRTPFTSHHHITLSPWTTRNYPHPPYGCRDVHRQIYWRLQLGRVTQLIPQVPASAPEKCSRSVNGTIKIIDCTGPINKACFQLGDVIRLILIMEKPLFLHCSPFALFSPGASHILWVGFHIGLGSWCFIWHQKWGTIEPLQPDGERHRSCLNIIVSETFFNQKNMKTSNTTTSSSVGVRNHLR